MEKRKRKHCRRSHHRRRRSVGIGTRALSSRLRDRMLEDFRQRMQPRRIRRSFRRPGTLFHRRRHLLQILHFAFAQMRSLSAVNRLLQIRNLIRRQGLGSRQLIQICLSHDQLCRPLDHLLILHVELGDLHRLRGVDFVLRQVFRRRQLKNVEPSRDFRCINVAVVPIRRPVATEHEHLRIDRSAIKVRDFEGVCRIGEIASPVKFRP